MKQLKFQINHYTNSFEIKKEAKIEQTIMNFNEENIKISSNIVEKINPILDFLSKIIPDEKDKEKALSEIFFIKKEGIEILEKYLNKNPEKSSEIENIKKNIFENKIEEAFNLFTESFFGKGFLLRYKFLKLSSKINNFQNKLIELEKII